MDKLTAALLGAVAGMAVTSVAQANSGVAAMPEVTSYADLLAPVPNAAAVLKAQDEAPRLELAQAYLQFQYGPPPPVYPYPGPYYQHHHHHHHRYYRPRYHHHHHHHHNQYGRG